MTAGNPQNIELSVPGKAFLAGEYLALHGGPALVAAVEPRFVLRGHAQPLEFVGEGQKNPFHEKSHAGILWERNKAFLQNFRLQFVDPHQGRGGWGASTAEFALLHSFLKIQKSFFEDTPGLMDLRQVWNDYRDASILQGQKPSGADLIAQIQGSLTLFDRNHGQIDQFAWQFKKLGFLLFRTKEKLATHSYLQDLGDFATTGFLQAMEQILLGLRSIQAEDFVQGMVAYGNELERLNFVSSFTRTALAQVKHPSIVAKKGCGAMGADVICVVYEKSSSAKYEIIDELSHWDLHFIASDEALADGLQSQSLLQPQRSPEFHP